MDEKRVLKKTKKNKGSTPDFLPLFYTQSKMDIPKEKKKTCRTTSLITTSQKRLEDYADDRMDSGLSVSDESWQKKGAK